MFDLGWIAVFVPAETRTVRGALVRFGGTFTTTGLATGDFSGVSSELVRQDFRTQRPELIAHARRAGLALIGVNPGSELRIPEGLGQVAVSSGRAELAAVPFLASGTSAGAPVTYDLAVTYPDRTLGFSLFIPATPGGTDEPPTRAIPGLFILAGNDAAVDNAATRAFFDVNRAAGALWALAIEPRSQHGPPSAGMRRLVEVWEDDVLASRLPATVGEPLVTLSEAAGWLGDLGTLAIAPYGAFVGDPASASWFPAQAATVPWLELMTE